MMKSEDIVLFLTNGLESAKEWSMKRGGDWQMLRFEPLGEDIGYYIYLSPAGHQVLTIAWITNFNTGKEVKKMIRFITPSVSQAAAFKRVFDLYQRVESYNYTIRKRACMAAAEQKADYQPPDYVVKRQMFQEEFK